MRAVHPDEGPPVLATEGKGNSHATITERAEAIVARDGTRGTHDNTVRVYHRTPLDCLHCGKRFLAKEANARRGYCSDTCKYKARHRGLITCVVCSRNFESPVSTIKTCSHKCKLALKSDRQRRYKAKRRERA